MDANGPLTPPPGWWSLPEILAPSLAERVCVLGLAPTACVAVLAAFILGRPLAWATLPAAVGVFGLVLNLRRSAPWRAADERVQSEINARLAERTLSEFWPSGSPAANVAKILEDAVARERGLPGVRLHPDDPMEIVGSGFDNLTTLTFSLGLDARYLPRKHGGPVLSWDDKQRLLGDVKTVGGWVEYACRKAKERGIDLSGPARDRRGRVIPVRA